MPPAPSKNQSSSALTPPLHQGRGSHVCGHILAIDANFRHKQRSPIIEMVHGERYKTLDYKFWLAFSAHNKIPLQLAVSYDIACQLRCCRDHLAHPDAGNSTQSSGVDMPEDDDLPELVKVENDDDEA
ncbi:hypothetical protein DFH09DRAFT_1328030 [Mycena vulgaris]|nr:hypothetical protein DFH09DRAFT_1332785 [Mycena vulgaris]KAJ6527558.1 hypothetical protein DFH09DRAFT_1328030 [Mycena vulgaris]